MTAARLATTQMQRMLIKMIYQRCVSPAFCHLSPCFPSSCFNQVESVHSTAVKKRLRKMFPGLRVTEADVKALYQMDKPFKASLSMTKKAKEWIRW